MTKTLLAVFGDTHSGSTLGLMRPRKQYELASGANVSANPDQRALWKRFEQYTDLIRQKREGRRLVVVLNGDLIDGDHHGTHQLHTRKEAEQIGIFIDCADYFLNEVGFNSDTDSLYVISGTEPTHGNGSASNTIARDLGAVPWRPTKDFDELGKPVGGWWPWARLRAKIEGHLFDIAHHPAAGKGTRIWTTDNGLRSYIRSLIITSKLRGDPVPDFWLRSHKHAQIRTFVEVERAACWAYVLPAWQLKTEYVYRIAIDLPTSIGGFWAEIERGQPVRHANEYVDLWQRAEKIVTV